MDADVVVVGAGLAGLVATSELTARGKRVALVDQEGRLFKPLAISKNLAMAIAALLAVAGSVSAGGIARRPA